MILFELVREAPSESLRSTLAGTFFNNVACISGFIQLLLPNILRVLFKAALQGYFGLPAVCEESPLFSARIHFDPDRILKMFHLHTGPFTK